MEIIEAQNFYKKKFGVMPVDDGYIFFERKGNKVCFARSPEALKAYMKGEEYARKTIKFLGWYVQLITVCIVLVLLSLLCLGLKMALLVLSIGLLFYVLGEEYQNFCTRGYFKQKKQYEKKILLIGQGYITEK